MSQVVRKEPQSKRTWEYEAVEKVLEYEAVQEIWEYEAVQESNISVTFFLSLIGKGSIEKKRFLSGIARIT